VTRFADWCGFFGAWLLFAGPFYQAQTELDEEAREADEFEKVMRAVPPPPAPSGWWWLLPPVAYVLHALRAREHRKLMRASLTADQNKQLLHFSEKAVGWLLVAGGAALIAVNETWTLDRAYGWGTLVFWLVVAVMLAASLSFTASRARLRHAVLGVERRQPRSRRGD
jgi:hypothetical protein